MWRFLDFELDEQLYELRRDGQVVELRRKVFDVLRYLVMHSDRLVTKDELLEQVWPGETIHEAVVAQNIACLRKVFSDSRDQKRAIQTVHGRGYRFVAAVERPSSARSTFPPSPASAAGDAPFVGREHTMRELTKLLDSARAGRGQFAVITGEAGIGKTRTSEELASVAEGLGARVYAGRCVEGEGAPAYWPWIQILRAATGDEGRARIGAELAHWLGNWSEAPRAAPLDSAEARFRLFDAIAAYLSQLGREQPLLLIFDDVHWADEATSQLLRFIAREVRGLRVLILATAREIDLRKEPATAALLAAAQARLYLNGLTPDAIAQLAVHAEHALSDASLRELMTLTEGNPFFVQQVLRLFADGAARSGRLQLPERVRDIIGLRLHGLDPRTQQLLALASVIGQRFALPVLDAIAQLARAQTLELLERALALRILREASDPGDAPAPLGKYEFAHALIREHLYATLGEGERMHIHARVGHALEHLYGVAPRATELVPERDRAAGDHLNELAYHFCRAAPAGDVDRAVTYCTRAAEHASSLLAFEQAVFHYQNALEALSCRLPIDEERRFALKLALGAAQFRAGEDGNPALLGAADIARRLERPALLPAIALAMLGRPRFRRHGRTDNSALEPLLDEVFRALPDDQALRSRLLSARALNGPLDLPLAQQRALCTEALALAHAANDDDARYDALLAELRLMQDPAHTRRRLAIADELLVVAQQSGHKERLFTAHELRVQPLLALGELRAADGAIAACNELANELRLPRCTLQCLRFALERALGDGRFDEVTALTKRAVHVRGKAAPSPGYLVSMYACLTYAYALRGDRAWFERHIDGMARNADKTPLMRAHVAFVYASFGALDQARSCYAALLEPDVLAASDDDDWLLALALTADAVAHVGDRAAAERIYPHLAPHAELNVTHFDWWVYFGSCAHWLGRLAALCGDTERAAAHFEVALAQNAKLGAQPALARSALAYAQLLLAGGGPLLRAQRGRGIQLRREAEAIARALGMNNLAREAVALTAHLA
jgi:DNA-binding winged helix-turn-helix (wHTH) protein